MRIVVTGGSGRLGRQVISELVEHGYEVLSLDRAPQPDGFRPSWLVDLANAGDIYQAFVGADAVVHLAAYIAPGLTSDTETFNSNVALSYNVLKAATDLGLHRVVMASSVAAYGFLYGRKGQLPDYLPIDEAHPCSPTDPYGLSKLVGESAADAIVAAGGPSVVSLRMPGVNYDPRFATMFERMADPGNRSPGFWSYIDVRDAARACRLALESNRAGHRIYNVAAPTSNMRESTADLVLKFLPGLTDIRAGSDPNWSGVDSTLAESHLGFRAEHLWQRYENG